MSSLDSNDCDCENATSTQCVNICSSEIQNWFYVFKSMPETICFQDKYYQISDIDFIFYSSVSEQHHHHHHHQQKSNVKETFHRNDLNIILNEEKFKSYSKITARNHVERLIKIKQDVLNLQNKNINELKVDIHLGKLLLTPCNSSKENKQFILFPENKFLTNSQIKLISGKTISHSKWSYNGNTLFAVFKLQSTMSLDEDLNKDVEEPYITLQYNDKYETYSRIIYENELKAFPDSSLSRLIKYGQEKEQKTINLNSKEEVDLVHLIYRHKLFAIVNSFGNKLDVVKRILDYLCISYEDLVKAETANQEEMNQYYQFFNQKLDQTSQKDFSTSSITSSTSKTCNVPQYTVNKSNKSNKKINIPISRPAYNPKESTEEDNYDQDDSYDERHDDPIDEKYNPNAYWAAQDYDRNDSEDNVDYDYDY
jgi:hypothetical protein